MKTRRKKKKHAKLTEARSDDRIPPSANRGGYVRIHHSGSVPVTARFHDVETAGLVVINEMDLQDSEFPFVKSGTLRDRFVKVAPRIPVAERDAFDGPAIAAAIRAAGARAVILAPVMVPEIRRVEPEQIVKRTPRETVQAWFDEQKAIDALSRAAALELVFGYMDEEGL